MINIETIMFFDIETVDVEDESIIEAVHPLPEMPTPEDAPVHYGEEAAANYPERRYKELLAKREKDLNSLALDIDTAQIRSIGWASGENKIKVAVGEEEDILKEFCEAWNRHSTKHGNKSCGFNSINYDWSVVLRRLAVLERPHYILSVPNMNRFSGEMDLMNIAYNFGYTAGGRKGLKTLAGVLGIEIPTKEVSGADVASLSDRELIEYNKSDVHITREIFKKFNGIYF